MASNRGHYSDVQELQPLTLWPVGFVPLHSGSTYKLLFPYQEIRSVLLHAITIQEIHNRLEP